MKVIPHEKYFGVYWVLNKKRKIATKNLVRNQRVYGEPLINYKGEQYRIWVPERSKLGAAILKGIKEVPIKEDSIILYLGVASGTTASHISDIAVKGKIFGVDVSERVLRNFIFLSKTRNNLFPILGDANKPSTYSFIPKVDIIYQDIAQPNQSEILIKNAKIFLKKGGYAFIAIKARSIDVSKNPKEIFREERKKLENYFEVLDMKRLEPYEKDHAMFLLRK